MRLHVECQHNKIYNTVLRVHVQGHPLLAAAMDANENPNVPATVNRNSSSAVDTNTERANNVVAIVREVSEMLNGIPYVQALSGVILQIIKVRDVRFQLL
jgi:hypothetical protein